MKVGKQAEPKHILNASPGQKNNLTVFLAACFKQLKIIFNIIK